MGSRVQGLGVLGFRVLGSGVKHSTLGRNRRLFSVYVSTSDLHGRME